MPLVVVIFGASGSGKSTLMEQLQRAGSNYSIHIKGTDRQPREYDGVEIRCVPVVTSTEYDYIYETYGYRYGIQRSQVDAAIGVNNIHFVICNDIPVIHALKRDYGDLVRVVFHHFDAPREALEAIQAARGIGDDEISLRLTKTEALYKTFVEQQDLFNDILFNHYGDDPEITRFKMENLLQRLLLKTTPKPEHLLSRLETFVRELDLRLSRESSAAQPTIEKGYVFIIMAMSPERPELEDSHAAIKRACSQLRMRAQRVDDLPFVGEITPKILASIRLAEYIVADLTLERPNVYYEIGYADALGKPIVLTARDGTKIHFDLQGKKILFYRSLSELERLVAQTLRGLR